MFGINPAEFIVLLVVAAVVLGPERLPQYAQQLARLVHELRRMAQGASRQVREEIGPEFDDIDWRKLDPRQYDPRRIVREALSETFDPDDPLGLKENGYTAADLRADSDGSADRSSNGRATSSNGRATSSNGRAASSNGRATSSNGRATSSNGRATSSNGRATGSDGQAVDQSASDTTGSDTPAPAFDPDAT